MNKKPRRELNIDDVFKKQKYKDIIYFIWRYQDKKIKFLHLRFALCKDHGIRNQMSLSECKEFFQKPNSKNKYLNELKGDYESGLLDKDCYMHMKKCIIDDNSTVADYWRKRNRLFTTFQTLENALRRLKKLNVIDTKRDKNGYDYYVFTSYGFAEGYKNAIYEKINYFLSLMEHTKCMSEKKKNLYIEDLYHGINKAILSTHRRFISAKIKYNKM